MREADDTGKSAVTARFTYTHCRWRSKLAHLDGIQVYGSHKGSGEPMFDLNSMSPSQIQSMEYYASAAQTPMEYSTMNSTCGVLVIWTRHGHS